MAALTARQRYCWRRYVRELKASLPKKRIKIRTQYIANHLDGDCTLCHDAESEYYLIRINVDLNYSERVNTLVHEIAHCETLKITEGHATLWGKAYSRAYQVYEKTTDKLREELDNEKAT